MLNDEVVLAAGKVVNAKMTSHTEDCMALKGDSSNFGIITLTDLAVLDNDQLLSGGILSPATNCTTTTSLGHVPHFERKDVRLDMMYRPYGNRDVPQQPTSLKTCAWPHFRRVRKDTKHPENVVCLLVRAVSPSLHKTLVLP